MKRVIKILTWIIVSLLMLVILALAFTQTAWFRTIVKNKLTETVNQSINGHVSIGRIDGNFFTWLQVNDLNITFNNGDTLANIKGINIRYAPIYLLKNEIRINHLTVINPDLRLSFSTDSIWNFEKLLPQKDTLTEKETSAPFTMNVSLAQFSILNGRVALDDFNPLTPEVTDSINLDFSLRYSATGISASLKHLGFIMDKPDFNLKTFRFDISLKNDIWKVSNFYLQTTYNQIQAEAGYQNNSNFNIEVDWPAIHAQEFDFALPSIIIPANPDFAFKAITENNQLDLSLNLAHNNQSIKLSGKVNQLDYLLSDSLRHLAPVDLTLRVRNFVPHQLIEVTPLPLVLNADIFIKGNGIKSSSVPLNIAATLRESRWENYLLEEGNLQLTYLAGKTETSFDLAGLFGELHVKAALDINTPKGPFTGSVLTKNLALHQLLPSVIDSTFLNTEIKASGTGIGSENPSAIFEGWIKKSMVEHVPIDSLYFSIDYQNGNLQLDTLVLRNNSIKLNTKGLYGKNGSISAAIQTELTDTKAFTHYINNPATWQKLVINADASGHIDSLGFNLTLNASQLSMDTLLSVNQISLTGTGAMVNKKYYADGLLALTHLEAFGYKMETASVKAELIDTLWNTSLTAILPDNMSVNIDASGNLGETIEASLTKLDFQTPYSSIRLIEVPAKITYNKNLVSLKNFTITDNMDTTMVFKADAMAAFPDSLILTATLQAFNLELLNRAGFIKDNIKGRAFLNINLEANRQNIELSGQTSLKGIESAPLSISEILSNINYKGDSAVIRTTVLSPAGDSILLKATSPLLVKLQDSLTISWPQTLSAQLTTHQTRLNSFFVNLPVVDQPNALVNMDISASGHIRDPYIKGFINITGGALPLPKYGINYRDMRLKLSVDGTSILLDSLFARHFNGTLLARGNLQMDSTITSGIIKSSDINIRANQFYLTRHRNHEIQIDANTQFRDIENAPRFGGNIKVLRSSFYLPALMKMAGGDAPVGDPLLVKALRKQGEVQIQDAILRTKTTEHQFTFMEKLMGTLKVEIPRNTWIKSEDMQMEVYGNLDVVKNSQFFELFGTVGIHRGYYTLYGKKLIIQEGEFTFSGGEAFNPMINLKASYVFRSKDRERQELLLMVRGTALAPEITFELNKQTIPEADAMAYLLFGQPFDELSYGNQEGVSNAIPSRMVSGLISSQLSRTIGNTLNLDMIEIDAGDNWQNTTFMVGKYITNNLFVTYQRSFGEASEQEITPEVITLEYEISRRLSLRLIQGNVKDSGIDIILKFEK